MRTTSTPEAFTKFANQHEPEYLEANYKELVREFSIKENDELKRKVKPPMILFEGKNVIVPYYPLCQYKAMAQEAINKPLANKQGVINTLLDVYINKPLKETKTDVSQVYNNLRNGANHFLTGNKFLYFSNLIAIEELIKFEMYLLNGCKDSEKTSLKDFFPTLETREIESLQNEFSKCRGIEMACFIHKINKDGHLELIKNSPKKSLSKFCALFGEMDKKEYEAVRKLFKYDTYILDNENYLHQYKTEEKINTALEVG